MLLSLDDFRKAIGMVKANEGLTQEGVAERLGINSRYLSSMMTNTNPITESVQEKLFELFPYLNMENNNITNTAIGDNITVQVHHDTTTIDKLLSELTAQREMFEKIINRLLSSIDKTETK